MPARNGSSWKRAEREIAKDFGTERVLRQGTNSPDARVPGWAFEIKKRKTFPGWLIGFFKQARANARPDERPAVLLVSAPGRGIKIERYVMLAYDDFRYLVKSDRRIDDDALDAVADAMSEAETDGE